MSFAFAGESQSYSTDLFGEGPNNRSRQEEILVKTKWSNKKEQKNRGMNRIFPGKNEEFFGGIVFFQQKTRG